MAQTPEILDARARLWRSVSRYRRLSALFAEDGACCPLLAVARGIETHLDNNETLTALNEELAAGTQVLLAEIDTLLMRARATRAEARALLSRPIHSSADMREEARLCAEEAQADESMDRKRSIAARAFSLAQFAEAAERDGRS